MDIKFKRSVKENKNELSILFTENIISNLQCKIYNEKKIIQTTYS